MERFSKKKEPIYDQLLFDLIYKLIAYNKAGVIKNCEDLFNHQFFKQYNY